MYYKCDIYRWFEIFKSEYKVILCELMCPLILIFVLISFAASENDYFLN